MWEGRQGCANERPLAADTGVAGHWAEQAPFRWGLALASLSAHPTLQCKYELCKGPRTHGSSVHRTLAQG